ncbi:hypothetical protein J2W40_001622 [Sphingobium xenophagum]|uniref:Uncharacterized protein n=1 Tax=Sphingobium xenophagum TaxID=121428 RepID=A0ABU1X0V2_SPHXE|nr:hypothetical protein [Sphingobium xenophagum]MDR7154807.1 hypothetical protein [Sphingobium xenophagum]
MKPPLIPTSYEEWEHCITVLCRISLTPAYVETRITALDDPGDHMTQRFVQTWGEAHLDRVRSWFRKAREQLPTGKLS